MAINSYRKGSTEKLSNNFYVSEFACHGSGCCNDVLIDDKLVEHLQKIRDHFGKEVITTSGYRCEKHNKNIGGASNSYHARGQAVDFYIRGVEPAEIAKYAESIGVLGIGLYETDADGHFVHIDTRTTKSFWYGQGQAYRSTFGGASINYDLRQFVIDVQNAIGATADGIPGNETRSKTVTISAKFNASHAVIKPVQKRLAALGYSEVGEADGVAGNMFTAALTHFQQDHGCAPIGIAEEGGRTWCELLEI